MTGSPLHSRVNGKRRGGCLPGRLRIAARRGVSLVELMISMLILAIVCIAWLQIIGIQSARKEARRREAVERLAGMMDAFMYLGSSSGTIDSGGYEMVRDGNAITFKRAYNANAVYPMFDGDVSPIGYRLCITNYSALLGASLSKDWQPADRFVKGFWLVGSLYNGNGTVDQAGKPFFTLSVCTGR